MQLKNYKELDGIRAIAALLVMGLHFFDGVPDSDSKIIETLKKISHFGQTGVTLFFVLSGFLITRILLATKSNHNYFKTFYIRRALRIFPVYYLYLIIIFCIVPFFTHNFIPLKENWSFWVYMQNFAITFNWPHSEPTHFWSLAVEEHFYFFWPLIIYFFNRNQVRKTIIICIVASLLCRIILLNRGYEVFYFTFTNMDALAIGSWIALIELKNGFKNTNANFNLLMFLVFLIPSIIIGVFVSGQGFYIVQLLKLPIIACAYYFLIIYVIACSKNNLFKRLISTKPFRYTGKISYGLYIFHPICFLLCSRIFKTDNIVFLFLVEFGSVFIIATISYYLYESIFLKLKTYFSYSEKSTIKKPENYAL